MILFKFLAVFVLLSTLVKSDSGSAEHRKVCTVHPCKDGSDDAPEIIRAFKDCGKRGRVEFLNETYHIESIMNISGLNDVEIDLKGTLLVSHPSNLHFMKANHWNSGERISATGWITRCQWDIRINLQLGFLAAIRFPFKVTATGLLMEMDRFGMTSLREPVIIRGDRMLLLFTERPTLFLRGWDLCRVRCGMFLSPSAT